jgi:hypothetical protein
MAKPVIPALGRMRQKDYEFEASLKKQQKVILWFIILPKKTYRNAFTTRQYTATIVFSFLFFPPVVLRF